MGRGEGCIPLMEQQDCWEEATVNDKISLHLFASSNFSNGKVQNDSKSIERRSHRSNSCMTLSMISKNTFWSQVVECEPKLEKSLEEQTPGREDQSLVGKLTNIQ